MIPEHEVRGSGPFLDALDKMRDYGGGFVKALSDAWRRADELNHQKLLSVFNDYLAEYAAMGD